MKVRDLVIIARYLKDMSEVALRVLVSNADGTKQICDVKEVIPYNDAMVINVDTGFCTDTKGGRKFQEGQIVIHKGESNDVIWQPHLIIQVDEAEKKYRLYDGSFIHFSEEDNYEPSVQIPNEIAYKYYDKAFSDLTNALVDNIVSSGADVVDLMMKIRKKNG